MKIKDELKNRSEASSPIGNCQRFAIYFILLALFSVVAGCASVTTTPQTTVDAQKNWALLPFSNLSRTPRAESQLAELVETALRARGVQGINVYKSSEKVSLQSLFDDSAQQRVASQWARDRGQDYALSGSVHEWQYRSGVDKQPTVGLTLKLMDVKSKQVIWQGNASRTATGSTHVSTVASQLVKELLDQITIAHVN